MCLPLLCGGAPGGAPQTKESPSSSSSRASRPIRTTSRGLLGQEDGTCTAKSTSYYVRNRCEGFLLVKDRRVLIQKTGLNVSHPAAEIVKETCAGEVGGRQLVRYRHRLSNMYICFNKKGAVKAVDAKRVDGKGTLCMFEEETVDAMDTVDLATYHTLRSGHNRRWYLGIGSGGAPPPPRDGGGAEEPEVAALRQRRRPAPGGGGHQQRFAAARRLVRPPADFCGSHFSSGRHGPPPKKAFYGVFDLVSDYMMDGNSSHRVNLKNSLAANTDSSSSSSDSDEMMMMTSFMSSSSSSSSSDRTGSADDGRRRWPTGGDTIRDDDTTKTKKISQAHLEALRMQHQLTGQRHRIRHAKHKRPRPSRQEKNRARQLGGAFSGASAEESALNM